MGGKTFLTYFFQIHFLCQTIGWYPYQDIQVIVFVFKLHQDVSIKECLHCASIRASWCHSFRQMWSADLMPIWWFPWEHLPTGSRKPGSAPAGGFPGAAPLILCDNFSILAFFESFLTLFIYQLGLCAAACKRNHKVIVVYTKYFLTLIGSKSRGRWFHSSGFTACNPGHFHLPSFSIILSGWLPFALSLHDSRWLLNLEAIPLHSKQ